MVSFLLVLFVVGYIAITLEQSIQINKSATALITAVLCWTLIVLNADNKEIVIDSLTHHLSSISEIVFFLLGAMTIVELIDAHDGFQQIAEAIKTTHKTKLVWLIALITFFNFFLSFTCVLGIVLQIINTHCLHIGVSLND